MSGAIFRASLLILLASILKDREREDQVALPAIQNTEMTAHGVTGESTNAISRQKVMQEYGIPLEVCLKTQLTPDFFPDPVSEF